MDITMKSLSEEVQISINSLIREFANIGINKTSTDLVNEKEKLNLLSYLNRINNSNYNKLILQRKKRSTLNVFSPGGKSKSIQIEIRKKHTYVRNIIEEKQENKDNDYISLDNEKLFNIEKNMFGESNKKNNSIKKNKYSEDINLNINKTNKNIDILNNINEKQDFKVKSNNEIIIEKDEKEIYKKDILHINNLSDKEKKFSKNIKSNSSNSTKETFNKIYNPFSEEDDRIKNNEKKEEKYSSKKKTTKHKLKKINSLNLSNIEHEELNSSFKNFNKNKKKTSALIQSFNKPSDKLNKNISIGENITVSELSNKMSVKGSLVIKKLIQMGIMANINQRIDKETAQLLAEDMGYKVIIKLENEIEDLILSKKTNNSSIMKTRAPIVTFMGHVDHGKTSLLDNICSTKVSLNEIGGITQRIYAYCLSLDNDKKITFLDTPGHSAFSSMRSVGAQLTDIIVLVVAADDGVMPQTIEAIQYAKSASVPIIVAINKIDKLGSNLSHIKNELSKYDVVPEEWGGDNQFVNVSAKFGTGINDLLEAILIQSEMLELKVVHDGMSNGVVIESFLDKGRGPVANIIIKEGTLRKGDVVVCGIEYGKIRAIRNQKGYNILSVGPSIPVEVLGISGVPSPGDKVVAVSDERKAREVVLYRRNRFREVKFQNQKKYKLENFFVDNKKDKLSELNIILKSDMQGSSEAIRNTLTSLSNNKIKINIIRSGVGNITESDAMLASTSNSILIGFNVRLDKSAVYIIKSENIKLRNFSIIYDLLNEVKQIINVILNENNKNKSVGLVEVKNIFHSNKSGYIAGCVVLNGIIRKNNKVRVLRENTVVYEGELESIRRFKEDVNEVKNGMECGLKIKGYNDIKSGDIIEAF